MRYANLLGIAGVTCITGTRASTRLLHGVAAVGNEQLHRH